MRVEEHSINRFNVAIERIAGAPCQSEQNERDKLRFNKQHVIIIMLLITDQYLI